MGCSPERSHASRTDHAGIGLLKGEGGDPLSIHHVLVLAGVVLGGVLFLQGHV